MHILMFAVYITTVSKPVSAQYMFNQILQRYRSPYFCSYAPGANEQPFAGAQAGSSGIIGG